LGQPAEHLEHAVLGRAEAAQVERDEHEVPHLEQHVGYPVHRGMLEERLAVHASPRCPGLAPGYFTLVVYRAAGIGCHHAWASAAGARAWRRRAETATAWKAANHCHWCRYMLCPAQPRSSSITTAIPTACTSRAEKLGGPPRAAWSRRASRAWSRNQTGSPKSPAPPSSPISPSTCP